MEQREARIADDARPLRPIQQASVRGIAQLLHLMQPLRGLGIIVGKAAIDHHQVAAPFEDTMALANESRDIREMVRSHTAGDQAEGCIGKRNLFRWEQSCLHRETLSREELLRILQHRRGKVAQDRLVPRLGQRQRGVPAAGGYVERRALLSFRGNEIEQGRDIAGVGQDVLFTVIRGLSVELRRRTLLLGVEGHNGGTLLLADPGRKQPPRIPHGSGISA